MPGVSANESNEIISQLQEVGRIISQETSQLVDALMHVTLDSEDTDKAIARMSIEANLAKAQNEDQTQAINNLRDELAKEKEKREQAEGEVRKVMNDLQELTKEFKSWKEKEGVTGENVYSDRDDLIKVSFISAFMLHSLTSMDSIWKRRSNTSKAKLIIVDLFGLLNILTHAKLLTQSRL